jgi:hypothetical protein
MSDDEDWVDEGSDDERSRLPAEPLVIEVSPGVHKSSEECSADELAAAGTSRLLEARSLMDESARLLWMAEVLRRRQRES